MARSITEIKASICSDFMANETMAAYYGYDTGSDFNDTFSTISFEAIMFYIVASAIFVLESLYDNLKTYVDAILAQKVTGNIQWLVDTAKAFQYGDALNPQTGKYDVVDESKLVVDYAAADEVDGQIYLKVARISGGKLAALDADQLAAFVEYIKLSKYAGVIITTISADGDDAWLEIDIYYDPMVLDADGQALDGSGEPAKDAVNTYLENLPFNGEFTILALEDALQSTDGVKIPRTLVAKSKYADNDWETIDAKVKPFAGYMVILDENLTLNYKPYDGY